MKYPQNFRNFSRTKLILSLKVLFEHGPKSVFGGLARMLVSLAIVSSALSVWYFASFAKEDFRVLGAESVDNSIDVRQEIERARKIIEKRPDYAAAWLRLAVLYEAAGELDLANVARIKATSLNPNLAF